MNEAASLETAAVPVATVVPPCFTTSETSPLGTRPYSFAIAIEIRGAVPALTGSAVTVCVETTPPGRPPKNVSTARTAAMPPATLDGLFLSPQTVITLDLRSCETPHAPTTVVRFAFDWSASQAALASL